MRQIPFLLAATLAACAGGPPSRPGASGPATVPNVPVARVDLERYAGTWYEQARLPMYFQRKCVADTTAHYGLNADGTVSVVNRCRREDGGMQEAEGIARTVGGRTSTLEVRFAPAWLSWLPAVWGDYWVIALDEPGYRWAGRRRRTTCGSSRVRHGWTRRSWSACSCRRARWATRSIGWWRHPSPGNGERADGVPGDHGCASRRPAG